MKAHLCASVQVAEQVTMEHYVPILLMCHALTTLEGNGSNGGICLGGGRSLPNPKRVEDAGRLKEGQSFCPQGQRTYWVTLCRTTERRTPGVGERFGHLIPTPIHQRTWQEYK